MDTATPPLHSRSERISPLDKNSSVKKHAPKRFDLKMEDKKKEEKDNPPSLMNVPPSPCSKFPCQTASCSQEVRLSQLLPADFGPLFEKMASSMILMTTSSEQITELSLDAPQFQNSVFYGTKITITEFSTAPKAFNVELLSSPQGTAQLALHTAAFLEAFGKGNFNFSVENLAISLLQEEEKPLFSRKESTTFDEEESQNS